MIPDTVSNTLNQLYNERLQAKTDISEHLPRLKAFVELLKPHNVVECGVRQGNSTLAFLMALQSVSGHLWSVDIDPIAGEIKSFVGIIGQWDFRQSDDIPYPNFFPDQAEIIFIDTSHELEQTRKEIMTYWPHLAPKGVMLFHDTDMKANPQFGVTPAIVEFCFHHPTWQTHFWENNNGLCALYRGEDAEFINTIIRTITFSEQIRDAGPK